MAPAVAAHQVLEMAAARGRAQRLKDARLLALGGPIVQGLARAEAAQTAPKPSGKTLVVGALSMLPLVTGLAPRSFRDARANVLWSLVGVASPSPEQAKETTARVHAYTIKKTKDLFDGAKTLCTGTDGWSSRHQNGEAFIGTAASAVIVSGRERSLSFVYRYLDLMPDLQLGQTTELLAQHLHGVLDSVTSTAVVFGATTDGASAERKLAFLMDEDGAVWCVCHRAHLAVLEFLRDPLLSPLVAAVASVAVKMSRTDLATTLECGSIGAIVPTRWESTHGVLEKFEANKQEILDGLRSRGEARDFDAAFDKPQMLSALVWALGLVKTFSKFAQTRSDVIVTQIAPKVAKMLVKLRLSPNETQAREHVGPLLAGVLEKRFSDLLFITERPDVERRKVLATRLHDQLNGDDNGLGSEPNMDISRTVSVLLCCCVWDPRFSQLLWLRGGDGITDDEARDAVWDQVLHNGIMLCRQLDDADAEKESETSNLEISLALNHAEAWSSDFQRLRSYMTSGRHISEELRALYLADTEFCVLKWCETNIAHQFTLSTAYVMAAFLGVMPSTAGVESMFSVAGHVASVGRASKHDYTVRAETMCRLNMPKDVDGFETMVRELFPSGVGVEGAVAPWFYRAKSSK